MYEYVHFDPTVCLINVHFGIEIYKHCNSLQHCNVIYRLGCPNFTSPPYPPTPHEGVTRSLFFPDEVIFPGHPRFKTLTSNIRNRRGEKVAINIPGMLSYA